jgi:hypothetical protein
MLLAWGREGPECLVDTEASPHQRVLPTPGGKGPAEDSQLGSKRQHSLFEDIWGLQGPPSHGAPFPGQMFYLRKTLN